VKYLEDTERASLEAFCWQRSTTEPRNAAMILLTLYSGCRAQELLNLTWNDLDLKRLVLKIKTLKRGKNRELPMSRRLIELLLRLKGATERIFAISYQRLNQIWVQWRPQNIKFHALRHTFAMQAYARTKDITLVKYILGHRSLSSTSVYLEQAFTTNQLKSALGVS